MPTIKARISAVHEDMAEIRSVTVFGHQLTEDYSEIEVSDAVAAKLAANPCIDVLVRKGKAGAGQTAASTGDDAGSTGDDGQPDGEAQPQG